MLSPKKVKWRRQHRPSGRGMARGVGFNFGDYALVATGRARLTSRQIEAARIAISRSVKRGGKLWIRVFPSVPITKKPAEVRMGKGKGAPEYWVCNAKPGSFLYEMNGVSRDQAREAFRLAARKLPVSTRFVSRTG